MMEKLCEKAAAQFAKYQRRSQNKIKIKKYAGRIK